MNELALGRADSFDHIAVADSKVISCNLLYEVYYRESSLGCCCIIIEHAILLMVTGEIRVAMTVSTVSG